MSRWLGGLAAACVLQCFVLGASAGVASAQRMHTVRAGETLSAIAHHYHVQIGDLAAANRLKHAQVLRAGEALRLPERGVTYVRPGQTLSHVAKMHDCTVAELRHLNRLRSAADLRAGERLILPGYMPAAARERDWGDPERRGTVTFLGQHGQVVRAELVDTEGRVRLKGLRALAQQMGRGDDASRHVHPRLALLLANISDHFGGRPIHVVSGFREARGYTRDTSRHVAGRAADIQIAGVPERAIWDYCRSLVQTGCGFYPHSVFVHVDVRVRAAQWVDWSRPGKRPRYGTLRRPYRRRERHSPTRPRVGRDVTRPEAVPLTVQVVNRHNDVVRMVDERPQAVSLDAPGAPPPTSSQAASLDPTAAPYDARRRAGFGFGAGVITPHRSTLN